VDFDFSSDDSGVDDTKPFYVIWSVPARATDLAIGIHNCEWGTIKALLPGETLFGSGVRLAKAKNFADAVAKFKKHHPKLKPQIWKVLTQ